MNRILYQFPISHYCEKARWLLDHKRLDYRTVNVLPGVHRLLAFWTSHGHSVPLLRDGREWVGDSTEMAFYLDARYAAYPLLPADPLLRSRAALLEEVADEAGRHLRAWLYGLLLDKPVLLDRLVDPTPSAIPVKHYVGPVILRAIRRQYRIQPQHCADAERLWQDSLDVLEQALLANGGNYLVGESLGLADIATAALFAPLLRLPFLPWAGLEEGEPLLQAVQAELAERPIGRWMYRLYAEERYPAITR